jgi:hypothetical protein
MTRVIVWDDWQSERRRTLPVIAAMASRRGSRPRDRRRTPEERRMLRRAALDAISRRETDGRLEWVGPRHAILK